MNEIWDIAVAAYNDNKGILKEYEDGTRSIDSEYDKKWIKALKSRIIEKLDDETRDKIIKTAKKDILNIFNAMEPTVESIKLYRTAWITDNNVADHTYPYAHQYKSLYLEVGDIAEIKIISSSSLTPYCEDVGIDCDFYRYEIFVPENSFILKLDQFECHNEEGEVLLPPMNCKVKNVRSGEKERCKSLFSIWSSPDFLADFSCGFAQKPQEYCMYFKAFGQSHRENMQKRRWTEDAKQALRE